MKTFYLFTGICLIVTAHVIAQTESQSTLHNKTLIAWAAPADLDQRGGSVLTIDDQMSHFDGIVFGELTERKWMAGSDLFQRTQKEQSSYPQENGRGDTFVQIAIVYKGNDIQLYRNGRQYAEYSIDEPQTFGPNSAVVFGKRHLDMPGDGYFHGKIADARIYDRALSQKQIQSLKPHQASEIDPWAWWSFAEGDLQDQTGHFTEIEISGDVRVDNGALVLSGDNALLIATSPQSKSQGWSKDQPVPPSVIASTREFRNRRMLLAAPWMER